MMKNHFLFVLLSLFLSSVAFAQTTLAIHNPRTPVWWEEIDAGEITDASIHVIPQGTYAKIELEMEIGAAHFTGWNPEDTLEIVMHFELPQDAFVTDSYLWINGERIQADIFERDFGVEVYEGYVDRNEDPSLLLKMNQGNFQLRVFPLPVFEARKLRIDFLVPTTWKDGLASATLPTQLLKTSESDGFSVDLTIENREAFPVHSFSNTAIVWDTSGDAWNADLTAAELRTGDYVSWQLPTQEGVWLEADANTNTYQYFIDTEHFTGPTAVTRDVAVVLHYNPVLAEASNAAIAQTLARGLENFLRPGDRLVIIDDQSGQLDWQQDWSDLTSYFLASGTNDPLVDKIAAANTFLNANATGESMVLVAGSAGTSDFWYNEYNALIDMFPTGEGSPTFYWNIRRQYATVDYYSVREPHHYINQWIAHTGGFITRHGSFEDRLFRTLDNADVRPGIFEVDLDPVGGLTYNTYGTNTDFGVRSQYFSYGSYIGDGEWELEAVSFINNQLESATQELSPLNSGSEYLPKMHVGHRLKSRELAQANSSSIANESIAERILSLYTVFLALDPAVVEQEDDDCVGCEGEDEPLVSTEDIVQAQPWGIEAVGNPVREQIRLRWTTAPSAVTGQIVVRNSVGQILATSTLQGPFSDQSIFWEQQLTTQWPAGLYVIEVQVEDKTEVIKVMVQ